MKTKKLTYPAWFYSPVVCLDYGGINTNDRKVLNNTLLNDDVLFCDVVKTSAEYQKLVSGMYITVIDFTFKLS